MLIPDYDNYYSLLSYASRFVSDPEDVVRSYFERSSSINNLVLWELSHENGAFKKSLLEEALKKMDEESVAGYDMLELIRLSNASGVLFADGDISADIAIYNDFVAYLTENGINS